jgi:hypothetical protein
LNRFVCWKKLVENQETTENSSKSSTAVSLQAPS